MTSLAGLLSPDLVLIDPPASSSAEVIESLADRLIAGGYARPSLTAAVLAREAEFPTGLELDPDGPNAAIPHADPEHVIASAAAIATFADPVAFRRMDDPDADVAVRLVVMLALADASSQIPVLRELTGMLQNAPLVSELLAARTPESLLTALDGGGPA